MKLSNKTLKKLIHGACYFEEERGFLYPFHFTKEQFDYLKGLDKSLLYWLDIAKYGTGIMIKLKTDAKTLSFDYNMPIPRGDNTCDLYINGELYKVFPLNAPKDKVSFDMPEGEKQIAVYMPVDCSIGVKNFTIDGHYSSVKPPKTKVLWYGDSITQGCGANIASLCYSLIVSREFNYDSLIQAIGGFRYESEIIQPIENFYPDKIIVALGINYHNSLSFDYDTKTRDFYHRIQELFPDVPVLVITPINRIGPAADPPRLEKCVEAIIKYSSENPNVTIVDGHKLVPEVSKFFKDGVHPNSMGYTYYGVNLSKEIKRLKF